MTNFIDDNVFYVLYISYSILLFKKEICKEHM
jgi:hypothetical protein